MCATEGLASAPKRFLRLIRRLTICCTSVIDFNFIKGANNGYSIAVSEAADIANDAKAGSHGISGKIG